MFRTSIKIISTVLAAAAVAVPVASAGSSPTTPSVGQGFSLGVPLEYLNTGAPTHATQGFSLGVPLEYLRPVAAGPGATKYIAKMSSEPTTPRVGQGFSLGVPRQYLSIGAPTHASQGFSLGVPLRYLAQPTATGGNGFDWADAGIGGGIVAGAFLFVLGLIAAVRTRPAAGHLSHT